ncbi:hypothetical protein [Pedobacter panaciterrae]
MSFDIKSAFQHYKNTVFAVETDLHFWESILNIAIEKYKSQPQADLFNAIFTAYNIDETSADGNLEDFKGYISVTSTDLESKKMIFLSWVRNLTTLKLYNALEVFIFQAIWLKYYPHLKNPALNKKSIDALTREIRKYLVDNGLSTDSKNNRYIIEFLTSKSPQFSNFFEQKMRTDLDTSWYSFFDLLSILRNIIAHQGTIVSLDSKNEILSKAKDVFQRHFKLTQDLNKTLNLEPIGDRYGNFILFINDLALNSIKFIFEERNFGFLESN